MDNDDVRVLIDTFKAYRDLISPIQVSLNEFIETYDLMKNDIEKLNTAFGGDVKGNLEKIYKSLSGQAEKATDLSSRIDKFISMTNKYTSEVTKLMEIFSKVEDRITSVNELEKRAEEQMGKLDAILEEKKRNYNVRELQRTLDVYNNNVQKVSEFINKDVADTLAQNNKQLDSIKDGMENVAKKQDNETSNIEKLVETYTSTNELLKNISERNDVNEAYIFEILDKWAKERKVKTKAKR